jgi:hypothetical protein
MGQYELEQKRLQQLWDSCMSDEDSIASEFPDVYLSERRGNKWYRKLAIELIFGSALVNAFLIYKEVTQKKIQITEFKELLAVALLGINKNPRNLEAPKTIHELHESSKNRCTICYAKIKEEFGRKSAQGKTPRTKWQCISCEKNFCVPCFFQTHRAELID